MKDILLLCSTLALLLSGFVVMNRLDRWIEHTQQCVLDELRTEPADETAKLPDNSQTLPNKPKFRESLWISGRLCDKIILSKQVSNYRGTGQCISNKKGI